MSINNIIKKYVNFILKNKVSFDYDHFKVFCKERPLFLKTFTETFHMNIWGESDN